MATSSGTRFLQRSGDDTDIALAMFWGTVLDSFKARTILWNAVGPDGVGDTMAPSNIVSSKLQESGASWEFPIMGDDPDPEYHTPGTELLGQNVALDKGTITIDRILVAHYDIARDHTAIAHFDHMRPFARKLGRALANQFDQNLFVIAFNASNTAASTGFHAGGNNVSRAGTTFTDAYAISAAGAQNLSADIGELAHDMDVDNVPEEGRYLFITPHARRVLSLGLETNWFDSDFSRDVTPNSLIQRRIGLIHGFNVMPVTNNMPSTNITDAGDSKYEGDFTVATGTNGAPIAIALAGADEGEAGVGYVAASDPVLGPIYAHTHFDERRNTTFMKAQMMCGAGVLAPYCAGNVNVNAA